MKIIKIFTISFLLIGSILAQEKYDSLKLINGKIYNKVEVIEKTPSGVSIRHEAGTARIQFKDFDDKSVKLLGGFDPILAEEHRKKELEKEAAANAAMDAELAKLAKSGKTKEQSLKEIQTQVQTSKSLTPEQKAERLRLVVKKLDKLKLEKSKGLR